MYSCWSVIFTCFIFVHCVIQFSVTEIHKEVEYVVKLFVYVGWTDLK